MMIVKLAEIGNVDIEEQFKKAVVIPTETVYGLAARIDNEEALKSIFTIKGRPSDNPLIVHISDVEMLDDLIEGEVAAEYKLLMQKFWPGPLTLLFKCKDTVSRTITEKRTGTISIRMPKNALLRSLIRSLKVPLAAPSANTSGKPSPTCVEHVIDDLGDKVSLYIDGGECEIGLESTVFSILDGECVILRPGRITREEIADALGRDVVVHSKVKTGEVPICPGQKYKHYSPVHPVYLFRGRNWHAEMAACVEGLQQRDLKIGILRRIGLQYPVKFDEEFSLGSSLAECSKNIFSGLRVLDKKCDLIFVVEFELEDVGLAIMDRLEKAATYIVG